MTRFSKKYRVKKGRHNRKSGKKSGRKGKPRKTRLRLRKAVGKRRTKMRGGNNPSTPPKKMITPKERWKISELTIKKYTSNLSNKQISNAWYDVTKQFPDEEPPFVIPVHEPHDFLKELINSANEPPPSGLKNQAENPIDKTIAAFMNEILKAMMNSGYKDTIITPEIEGLYEKTFLRNIPINAGESMQNILDRKEVPTDYTRIEESGNLTGYILTFVLKTNNKYIHKITVDFNGKKQEDFENHEYTHEIIKDVSLNEPGSLNG